ncbi:MAG: YihY family inner membrane protein [Chitinivibrionales bacterium]|nr:YihY family inner membrane protein [Chitinivibrionales bacterium]MBD3355974.1 YihY family inner membrane protein [Chitinivibrionales bacterium]
MGRSLKDIGRLLKDTVKNWVGDKAPQSAAAVAFYTIFSLSPLVIAVVGMLGFVLSENVVREALDEEIRALIGPRGAALVNDTLTRLADRGGGIVGTVVGVLMTGFGATTVFAQLQNQLNAIWNVEAKPGKGALVFIRTRILSFGFVLILGFLLLVSLAVDAALSGFASVLADRIPDIAPVVHIGNFVVWTVIVTALFAGMFKYLPDVQLQWRDVIPAAILTSILFSVGRYLIGLYLGHSAVVSAYGAAGSLVIILLWVYFSCQLFFFGAEFSKAYTNRRNHDTPVNDFAVRAQNAKADG